MKHRTHLEKEKPKMYAVRSLPRQAMLMAIVLFALAALQTGCMLFETPPAPAPIAAPAPTPVPTPPPSEFVDYADYFSGQQAVEKIPATLQAASEDLRLAAVMDVLNTCRAEFPQSGACYIAIGPNDTELRDPSDTLLGALKADGINIKKYTQCVNDESGVRDAANGARGVVIKVVRICWSTPNCALVQYGYSTGGIHGCMTQAEAEKVGGAWILTPRKVAIY